MTTTVNPGITTTTDSQCPLYSETSYSFGIVPQNLTLFETLKADTKSLKKILLGVGTSKERQRETYVLCMTFIYEMEEIDFGNCSSDDLIITTHNVNVEKSLIIGMHIRSGVWIDQLQFRILDLATNTVRLTQKYGGGGGSQTHFFQIGDAKFLEINSFTGFVDYSNQFFNAPFLRSLKFDYSYSYCDLYSVPVFTVPVTTTIYTSTVTSNSISTTFTESTTAMVITDLYTTQ